MYVSSYLRLQDDKDLTTEKVMSILPFISSALAMANPFGKYLADKIGDRLICSIAICGMSLCVFISSFATTFIVFVLFYGFLFGIFAGVAYMSILLFSIKILNN
jgi:MFS family permease